MFQIQWRRRMSDSRYRTINQLITGESRYPTLDSCLEQIKIWKTFFPFNEYYIVPAN